MERFAHPRGYICHRVSAPFPIDGDLSKPAWSQAPWTQDFVDIEGDSRPAPRFRTRAKMLWDDAFLYIAAEMEEPHVWGTLTEHDAVIFQDNDFEVFLDPDGDHHDYYELEINALNTTWDLRLTRPYRDGGSALNDWEIPGMRTAVKVLGTLNDAADTDIGWSVEIALPWAALGEYATCATPPRDGDQWRINFSRVEWDIEIVEGEYRKIPNQVEHNWVWSPQYAIDMHRPELWGYVQFSDGTPGAVAFQEDVTWETRCRLIAVYHTQKAFFAERGRWGTHTELRLAEDIALERIGDGWQAAATERSGRRCAIRHDSRWGVEG